MTYTPNTWANGDVITAGKLNAMESGISGADTAAGNAATAAANAATAAANADKIFMVNVTGVYDETTQETTYTSNKTVEEIIAAVNSGKIPIVKYFEEDASITNMFCLFNSGYYEDGVGEAIFSNGAFVVGDDTADAVAFTQVIITTDYVEVLTSSYNFPTEE